MRHIWRTTTAACAATTLLAALAGCGQGSSGAGSGGSTNESKPLTKEQVSAALLTAQDIGPAYAEVPDDDDTDSKLGCLAFMDTLGEGDAAVSDQVQFSAGEDDLSSPSVDSLVESYEDTGQVVELLDSIRGDLDGCDSIRQTADDVTFDLKVASDDEKATSDVDEQINISATGTATSSGLDFPIDLRVSLVRLDNHLTAVAVSTLGSEDPGLIAPLTEVAVGRLAAVAAGEEPPAPQAVASEEAPTGESSSEAGMLPLDGGSYTWSSGVKMTLSVERVEPWGDTDDFCGDGSCGVANPNDTRMVLRYEVSVPEDYPGPFDPSSCPGELHVTTGNDDEAFSGVAGDYYAGLDGKIFPGSTKFGVDEYYIEKAYADKDFYLESFCGDPDNYEESVYFTGPVKDVN